MDKTALTNKKKQMIFRCAHRGTKEMDLFLGNFAKQYVPGFDEAMLLQFEEFITNPDPDIYNWITRREEIPEQWNNDVAALLLAFDLHQS